MKRNNLNIIIHKTMVYGHMCNPTAHNSKHWQNNNVYKLNNMSINLTLVGAGGISIPSPSWMVYWACYILLLSTAA